MHSLKPLVVATALASSLLLVGGCGQQGTNSTVGQKMDRTADKVADTTSNAK